MNKLLLGLAMAGLAGTSAKALSYSDTDLIFAPLSPVTPTYDALAGTANNDFNIVVDDSDFPTDSVGYVPGTPITAEFGFTFVIAGNSYDVSYTLGVTPSGSIVGVPTGTTFSVGGSVGGLALADLKFDGVLEYTVSYVSGPAFIVTSARLTAETVSTVPDGGSSVMLLGSAMMGMAALAPRKK